MTIVETIKNKIKNPLLQRMFVYAFSDGLSKAIPFLIFPIVAAFLTTEEFGYVSNFSVLTQILLAFVIINSHTYLTVDYYKINIRDRDILINNTLLFLILNTVVVLIVVILLRAVIQTYLLIDFFWQIAAVFWAFGMASIYLFQAYLRVREKTRMFASFKIIQASFSAILTFILVVIYKFGLQGRLYSLFIAVFSFGLFGYFYLIKSSSFSLKNLKFNLKPIYFFGLPLLPHTISFWIKGGIDKIYITKFISLSSNGIYAFALTFMVVFSMFTSAFFSAYTPHLFKTLSQINENTSEEEVKKIKFKIVKETAAFLVLFFVLLLLGYIGIYFIIKYLFFDKFGDALEYLHLLTISSFVSSIYAVFSSYLMFLKKTKILGVINFSGAIVHTVINYFIIQSFGIQGMVLTNLTMLIITTSFIIYKSDKLFPMPWKSLFNIKI
jgi:O-antigen/teichoic acid export membrane protein